MAEEQNSRLKKALFFYIIAGIEVLSAHADSISSVPSVDKTPVSALSNIRVKGEMRPRYEYVHTNDTTGDAKSFTNRLMLRVDADLFSVDGLAASIESVNVSGFGHYWDLSQSNIGDKPLYNIVADPSQTRLTQAYVDYGFSDMSIKIGRQRVNLDKQRFVGTVNWRQMPQTYDALTFSTTPIEGLSLLALYVWQVNTVFDKDTTKKSVINRDGDHFNTQTILLHTHYKIAESMMLTAYDYMIEDMHDTYGIALTGNISFGGTILSYRGEYAKQKNPTFEHKRVHVSADATYYNIEATIKMDGMFTGVKYEVLGAGNGVNAAFGTPLATLHGQNGWADMFLVTPLNGLVDMNGMIGYKSKDFGLAKIVYHDFSSDQGGINYGREIDLVYKNNIPAFKGVSGMIKASFYNANRYKADTQKYWAMVRYTF